MLFASVAAVVLATAVVQRAGSKHYLQARRAAITITQHLAASKRCTNTNPAHLRPPQEAVRKGAPEGGLQPQPRCAASGKTCEV